MRARSLLLGWLLLLGLWGWALGHSLKVGTDLTLFLPRAQTDVQRLLISQLREGPGARLILIAIEQDSPETLARVSRVLTRTLRQSELYLRVENGEARPDPELQARVLEYRYLLSRSVAPERFGVEGLQAALQERLYDLASPAEPFFKDLLSRDPTGELLTILEDWQPADAPHQFQGVWFSRDGKRALVLAETRAGGFDTDTQAAAVAQLHTEFDKAAAGTQARLLATGPGPFGVAIAEQSRRDAEWFSTLDSIVLALLLLLAYRTPRFVILTAMPLATAVLAALTVTSLVYGGIHGITLAFGSTLLGVALDYPVHVFSHRLPGNPWQGLRHNWPTLWTSVVMACVAYLALVFTDFPGLAQLGVFTVTGLVTAAIATRWLLPALLPEQAVDIAASRVTRWQARIDRWPSRPWLAPVLIAFAVLALVLSPNPLWENDLGSFSPVPQTMQDADSALRAELGTADVRYLAVVKGRTAEEVLQRSEQLTPRLQALVEHGALTGYDHAARYLPSQKTQMARREVLPPPAILKRDLEIAVRDTPFRADLFGDFLTDVERARSLSPLTPEQLQPGDVLGLRVAALLSRDEQAGADGADYVALIPLHGLRDVAQVQAAFATAPTSGQLLDLKTESEQMVTDFRSELLRYIAAGVAVMVLLMVIGLRARQAVQLVILPTTATVAVLVATINLLGLKLSLFHLVALMLVVGISIDYALYLSRGEKTVVDRARSLHSLLICCLATATAFGILALSQIPVLRAIGTTVAAGVVLGLALGVLGARAGVPADTGSVPDHT